jgi:hypothetical protein
MWHELQTIPVCRAKLGIAWDSVAMNGDANVSAAAAILIALLVSHFMILLPLVPN